MLKTKRLKTGGRTKGVENINRKNNFVHFKLTSFIKKTGVYFVKCENRYKIGISTNLYHRISMLNTANAFGIEIVNILIIQNPLELEQSLHKILKNKLIHGKEWFVLDILDIEIVKNISVENIEKSILNLKNNNGILF